MKRRDLLLGQQGVGFFGVKPLDKITFSINKNDNVQYKLSGLSRL